LLLQEDHLFVQLTYSVDTWTYVVYKGCHSNLLYRYRILEKYSFHCFDRCWSTWLNKSYCVKILSCLCNVMT